jgi:hypothetical protein
LFYTNSSLIYNNDFTTSNGYGIYLFSNSSYNNISYNRFTTTGDYGFAIFVSTLSRYNFLGFNNISTSGQNGYGIYTSEKADFLTTLNNIIHTSGLYGAGVYLTGAFNNFINGDSVSTTGQKGYGFVLYAGTAPHNNINSSNNIFQNVYFNATGINSYGFLFEINNNYFNTTIIYPNINGKILNNALNSTLVNFVLTNTLLTNGTSFCNGTKGLVTDDVNITLAPNEYCYILDNYNITEGVTREHDPISVTGTSTSKTITSTLTDSINATIVVNAECSSYGVGTLSVFYNDELVSFTCNNDQVTIYEEVKSGVNNFTASYNVEAEYTNSVCISGIKGFASIPLLVIILLGAIVIFIVMSALSNTGNFEVGGAVYAIIGISIAIFIVLIFLFMMAKLCV